MIYVTVTSSCVDINDVTGLRDQQVKVMRVVRQQVGVVTAVE